MTTFKMDNLTIEILEDGTIRTTTDAVSGANHANAEQFLKYMSTLAGGETTRAAREGHQHSSHSHHHGDNDYDHQH